MTVVPERQYRKLFLQSGTLAEPVSVLTSALGIHNAASKGHVERTKALVGEVAVGLELGVEETWTARHAAVLHDIGKIHIPSSILCKPGKLNKHEWEIMRRHPEIGAEMLSGIPGLERVRAAVLAHHERFDGRGYPAGLAGDEIPAEARLISVVDAYDAMTNDRPYRKALSHEEAIAELEAGAGSQFDPFVVEAVKAVLG